MPLRVSNSFSYDGEQQWFRDLADKIKFKFKEQMQNPITKEFNLNPKVDLDWKFLKEVKTEILVPEIAVADTQRVVPEYDLKTELKKLTI